MITTAATLIAATALTMTPAIAQAPAPAHLEKWMTTPCALEDSPNCFWDASEAGNGKGHSFYSIRIGRQDCIRYWNARYNRKHGACYPR
jgi:hypothetical protein